MSKTTTIIKTKDYLAKMVNGRYHSLKYTGEHTPVFTLGYEGLHLKLKAYNYDNYFELEEAEQQKQQVLAILEQIQSIEGGAYDE